MNNLNIYELHHEIHKKKESRTVTYDKVLDICNNKIRIAAKKELYRLYFEVPEFVIGLPVYDLNECIQHVMSNLKRNQLLVYYYFPKILYISWDWEEINKSKTLKLTNEKLTNEKATTSESSSSGRNYLHIENNNTVLPRESDRLLMKKSLEFRPNGKFRLNID